MENGYINYLAYLIGKLKHAAEGKAIFSFFLSIFSFFFDPLQQTSMLALFMLVIMDFGLGTAAARHTGDKIRSAKLVRTAIKLVVYFTLVSAARITEHTIPFDFLDTTVIGFLAATELLSVLENTGRLGFAVPKKLIKILGDFITAKNEENGIKSKSKK